MRKRKALRWRITINYNTRYNELLNAGWLKSLIRGNKHLSLNHQIRTCRESRRKWRIDFRLYDSQLSLFPQRSIARRINRESSLLLVFTGGKTFFFFFFFSISNQRRVSRTNFRGRIVRRFDVHTLLPFFQVSIRERLSRDTSRTTTQFFQGLSRAFLNSRKLNKKLIINHST